jgi:hypothetical protein
VLAEVTGTPAGSAATPESVASRLHWFAPRRGGAERTGLVRATLREAEVIGLLGRGAAGSATAPLLAGNAEQTVSVMRRLLPTPLHHVLIQADLTAVAPGPLEGELASRLRLVADVESTGGATVYRFSDASVRRALDAGWSASELLSFLAGHSRTPVPQPLTYLVEDVARRHGRLRVGAASAYLRCDDEGTLDELVADRRSADLRLRRLAPTVAAAQATVDVVLGRLRDMGYAPAAEGPDGAVLLGRPEVKRASPRRQQPLATTPAREPSAALLDAAVRAVRAGDRALTAVKLQPDAWTGQAGHAGGPGRLARKPAADILAMLADASRSRTALWIGYVSAEGSATQRVVEPISVEGGYLSAYDHLRNEVRTFALHRITGVSAIDETAS